MGQDLSSMGLIHCTTVLGNAQFIPTFIKCRNFQKELVIGLDIQQLHHLGCDLMENSHMFLYWYPLVLIYAIDTVAEDPHLRIISNIERSLHCNYTKHLDQMHHVYMRYK